MRPVDWGDDPSLHDPEGVELNLTPLVDVVLVLLVVFMVSSAVVVDTSRAEAAQAQVELQLPSGAVPANAAPMVEVVLQVDLDGALYEGGQSTDWKALTATLVDRLAKEPDLQVRIDSDQRLPVQRLVEVISGLQALGIRNVGLGTKGAAGK
ncbi:MAG: biopolymer transporter ExbD [Myxococcales bacterium]|nr:biopolymer transporter ExbD [Myxococcales bacterium]